MISVYRWKPGQTRGTWDEHPALPADGQIPAGEIWWVDLENPTDDEEAAVLQKFRPIHALSFEDVRLPRRQPDDPPHLPKVEEFPDYLFVVANSLRPSAPPTGVPDICALVTQLSAVVTPQVLITHHYLPLPSVAEVRQYLTRHAEQAGRGPDYLFHLVLDHIVDDFAPEIDRLIERLDGVELTVVARPSRSTISELIHLKRRVIIFRKTLILMREVLARLTRGEFDLVDAREMAYYRNVFDHLVRYTELIEGAREMVSDLMQTHLAAVSNQLNGIMKVLAMISTIILPMSLIAGIYGMNFPNMPEIEWRFGYPFALVLMALAGIIPLVIFYRKRWL